jgi:hypothetical protein
MADIVTFDPEYFQELIKNLKNASESLGKAKGEPRSKTGLYGASVGLDSGLVAFAMCCTLNDNIKNLINAASASIDAVGALSGFLGGGVMRVNRWEATTKNLESSHAAELRKIWVCEGGNFKGDSGVNVAPDIDR